MAISRFPPLWLWRSKRPRWKPAIASFAFHLFRKLGKELANAMTHNGHWFQQAKRITPDTNKNVLKRAGFSISRCWQLTALLHVDAGCWNAVEEVTLTEWWALEFNRENGGELSYENLPPLTEIATWQKTTDKWTLAWMDSQRHLGNAGRTTCCIRVPFLHYAITYMLIFLWIPLAIFKLFDKSQTLMNNMQSTGIDR